MSGHVCHAEGCNKAVPPAMFMCRPHWFAVPPPLRAAVWRHYRPGQEIDKDPSEAYRVVAKMAVEAVAQKEGRR